MLKNLTTEQKEKLRLGRANAVAERRASTLRTDFADSGCWDDLAREKDLRLPPWGQPCTVSRMRTFIHKAGMTETECKAWLGCSLAKFGEYNPDWPGRAFAGLVLEQIADK